MIFNNTIFALVENNPTIIDRYFNNTTTRNSFSIQFLNTVPHFAQCELNLFSCSNPQAPQLTCVLYSPMRFSFQASFNSFLPQLSLIHNSHNIPHKVGVVVCDHMDKPIHRKYNDMMNIFSS